VKIEDSINLYTINYVDNKTENLFSPYPRSVSDINWYTKLKIAMSCYLQGKLAVNCRPTAVRKLAILPVINAAIFLQGCRARLPGKAAGQGCMARVQYAPLSW
jgi:hypothetical protein